MDKKSDKQAGPATRSLQAFNAYLVMPNQLDSLIPRVTFCGSCNYVGPDGQLVRNPGRDVLIQWARKNKVLHYEVQIHTDIHGRDYNYETDAPVERHARECAKLRVYEIMSFTPSSVSFAELMQDAAIGRASIVWLRSGAKKFIHPQAGSRAEIKHNQPLREAMGPMFFAVFDQLLGSADSLRTTVLDFIMTIPNHKITVIEGDDPSPVIAKMREILEV